MMKSFDILYSLQVLTFVLYETGSVHLPSTINNRVEEECESIIHRRKDQLPLALNYTPKKVYEGQSLTLCCCSNSLAKSIEIWGRMAFLVNSSKHDRNIICHKIMNVSRHDSGVYRCFADSEIGIFNDEIMIEVLYPPNIQDQHINVTDNNISLTLQCLARGLPTNYTYGRWKHLSFFYQHIRYLDSTIAGSVTLPPIETKYQDNGIYICTASNGVVDRTGNGFQNGKIFLIANGPPVFMTKIDKMQYDQPGKIFNLIFNVYTKSQIKSYNMNSANNDIPASMLMTSVNKTMNFHGTLIYVEAIEVVLSFKTATVSNCHNYTVTLGNGYGNNSFVVELKPVQEDVRKINNTRIAVIIISAILLSCVGISGIAICLKRKRQYTHKDNSEAEGFPVPMNHRKNNREERKVPLTDVQNRTVQVDSRHVLRSNETGYADVWC